MLICFTLCRTADFLGIFAYCCQELFPFEPRGFKIELMNKRASHSWDTNLCILWYIILRMLSLKMWIFIFFPMQWIIVPCCECSSKKCPFICPLWLLMCRNMCGVSPVLWENGLALCSNQQWNQKQTMLRLS